MAADGGIDEAARGVVASSPAGGFRGPVAGRLGCSSLCQSKEPLDKALETIAGIGFKYVDLSALSWAPHLSVDALVKDFDAESERVAAALARHGLTACNLTYDPFGDGGFDDYVKRFEALARFAGQRKIRLINLMAPAAKSDRDLAVARLRQLAAIARRHGVLLSVETHVNQLTERPADAKWLCAQVPGLGLTLDPSHYYAGPNQGRPFDDLYPLVLGTGLRAGGMSWAEIHQPWGEGVIDFAEVVSKLERAGYGGCYVAEYIQGFNEVDAVEQARRFYAWGQSLADRPATSRPAATRPVAGP